jgi:hypothetical protein
MNRNPRIREAAADMIGLGALILTIAALVIAAPAFEPHSAPLTPMASADASGAEPPPGFTAPMALIQETNS